MSNWYLYSNPSSCNGENFAFFILLNSGSIEKLVAFLKSAFSRIVFENLAPKKSEFVKTAADKSAEEKSTSLRLHLIKFVFFNLVPKKVQ
jgi:hypothetical protein